MRVLWTVALSAAMLVSCADSDKGGAVLPEFSPQHFEYKDEGADIDIVCQRINDVSANPAWERIDLENCIRTLPHIAADTIVTAEDVETAVARFIEEYCGEAERYGVEHTYQLKQEVLFARQNEVVCFQTEIYTNTGGVHGSEQLIFDCYDLNSGSAYDFGYLLDSEAEWGEAMSTLLQSKLVEQYPDVEFDLAVADMYMPESVLISDTGLLLVYQPYEIAPIDYVTVELTDEDISATGAPLVWSDSEE